MAFHHLAGHVTPAYAQSAMVDTDESCFLRLIERLNMTGQTLLLGFTPVLRHACQLRDRRLTRAGSSTGI